MKIQQQWLKYMLALLFIVVFASFLLSNQGSIWKNPPKKKLLSNGLAVIYQNDPSSPLTELHIVIKGGKAAQPEGQDGVAYLTTRLLLEIPERRKVQDLMNQGSRVSMLCKMDYIRINIACLSENLEDTLDITTRNAFHPLFSSLRINNVKQHMIHMREREEYDTKTVGHHTHIDKFFRNTILGGPILGQEESLEKISKKDIENFYRSYFVANNTFLVVCTDMEEEKLIKIVKKYFKKFRTGIIPDIQKISPSVPQDKSTFIQKETIQSLVSLAFPLPELTQKSFVLAFMLENLLGAGVDSKLWPLRAEKKLAYEINAKATPLKAGGILEAYLETDHRKSDIAAAELKKVFQSLYEKGITEEELQATKINSKTHFVRGNETKEIRVQNFDFFEASDLGIELACSFLQKIDKITLEEINAFIKNVLSPEKRIEVIVGPKEK
ncbi:MAG: insulinase family protein [Candidatus Aminicenantes bacterium]|nr:MAG: insulinase family protein [Candidatus Aminicenantes bacterium]